MVITAFQIFDKVDRSLFFQKRFLLANINIEAVLYMPFLTLHNVDVQFAKKKLILRIYTTKEALPTTSRIEFINQKKVAKAALNENIEAFVVYIGSVISKITIYPARKA